MPDLDLSDAFAPEFLDDFTIIRRYETVDSHGRSVVSRSQYIGPVSGVIGPVSPDDLQRLPEGDYTNKAISIDSMTYIQGSSPGRKTDEISWAGSRYTVMFVDDYSRYGVGFVHAVAVSLEAQDPPPQGTA